MPSPWVENALPVGGHSLAVSRYREIDFVRRREFDPEHPDRRRAPRPEFLPPDG